MATRPKQSIAQKLNLANVAVSNALSDPQIGKYLSEYGYKTPKLSEGKTRYEAADVSVKLQVAALGEKKEASARQDAAEKRARTAYQDLSQVAKAVFKRDPESLAALGLDHSMPKPLPLFLTMAAALFDNASHTEAIANRLAEFGYPLQKLSEERGKVAELSAAVAAHESASGASQQATFEQNRALDALEFWMSAFVKVAKVALRTQPQLLEKLGILKRNSKTKAQRGASSKAAATREAKKAQPPAKG